MELDDWLSRIDGATGAELLSLRKRCVMRFASDAHYASDERLLGELLMLVDAAPAPLEIFDALEATPFGRRLAHFWIAWAWSAEAEGRYAESQQLYSRGLSAGAAPRDSLQTEEGRFKLRMASRRDRCRSGKENSPFVSASLRRRQREQRHAALFHHNSKDAASSHERGRPIEINSPVPKRECRHDGERAGHEAAIVAKRTLKLQCDRSLLRQPCADSGAPVVEAQWEEARARAYMSRKLENESTVPTVVVVRAARHRSDIARERDIRALLRDDQHAYEHEDPSPFAHLGRVKRAVVAEFGHVRRMLIDAALGEGAYATVWACSPLSDDAPGSPQSPWRGECGQPAGERRGSPPSQLAVKVERHDNVTASSVLWEYVMYRRIEERSDGAAHLRFTMAIFELHRFHDHTCMVMARGSLGTLQHLINAHLSLGSVSTVLPECLAMAFTVQVRTPAATPPQRRENSRSHGYRAGRCWSAYSGSTTAAAFTATSSPIIGNAGAPTPPFSA